MSYIVGDSMLSSRSAFYLGGVVAQATNLSPTQELALHIFYIAMHRVKLEATELDTV